MSPRDARLLMSFFVRKVRQIPESLEPGTREFHAELQQINMQTIAFAYRLGQRSRDRARAVVH